MFYGSNLAFIKKKAATGATSKQDYFSVQEDEDDLDTNVISVNFKTLKQAEENLQMGDASFCKQCKSCISSISKILTKVEYLTKFPQAAQEPQKEQEEEKKIEDDKEEEKKLGEELPPKKEEDKIITGAIGDNEKVWICEFCGVHNIVNIEAEEIPKSDDVIYLLQSAQQISKNPSDLSSDITTILCIDNSGSMSVTQEIKGKHDFKHGLSEEEYEMLKQFIENGADQYLPNQKKDTTFISRKQCVLAAIEDQLLALKNEYPNRKVGLVTFNSEVTVIGDGQNIPETIAGDKLYNFDVLQHVGEDLSSKMITSTIKESAENLIKKFETLKEAGKTALGPALLVSLSLAIQGKPGSRVIICTDGLANVGLGEMDTEEGLAKAQDFYTQLGFLAKEKGVSISVISIKGEGCNLDIFGDLVNLTSGSVVKVDPSELTSKFSSIMKNEIIGTQVDVKLRLHQAMTFRNQIDEVLLEEGSFYQNKIGNVTAKTELTFEYEIKPDDQLKKHGLDSAKMETVPFQAQIVYNSTNGDKLMRVITKSLNVTEELEEAEAFANVNVIAKRAIQQQGKLAEKKLYSTSNEVGDKWGKYLNEKVGSKADSQGQKVLGAYKARNDLLRAVTITRNAAPVKKKVFLDSADYEFEAMNDAKNCDFDEI